jgi:hypothetical protein
VFDVTNCAITIDLIIVALGLLGMSLVWSRYKVALFVIYLSTMYWAYTLYQSDLLQMIGQNAFYWSAAGAIALGSLLFSIITLMPGRH